MAGDNRIQLRRRNPYNTARNHVVPVRTPGNKLVAHYLKKRVNGPHCAETHKAIPGIRHLTTKQLKNLPKNERTVSRAYGGVYLYSVVKDRIINAFIQEETRFALEKEMNKAAAKKK